MREVFSKCLLNSAKMNKNFLVLTGDHGYGIFDKFKKKYKSQFINAGVAEQNMVGVAAGLSRLGFIPLVYGLSSFIPLRVYEQIKLDVAHDNLKVIFIGDGAGVVYSYLGTSHQSNEDIACVRAIPNIKIFSPADVYEMQYCYDEALKTNGPSYIRIGKSDLGPVHKKKIKNKTINSILKIKINKDSNISLIATGSMVVKALKISEILNCSVFSVPNLKPINKKQIYDLFSKNKYLITLEEHSVLGGLGSIICEISAKYALSKVLTIGVEDMFTEKCGNYEYTLGSIGLGEKKILNKIKRFINY